MRVHSVPLLSLLYFLFFTVLAKTGATHVHALIVARPASGSTPPPPPPPPAPPPSASCSALAAAGARGGGMALTNCVAAALAPAFLVGARLRLVSLSRDED